MKHHPPTTHLPGRRVGLLAPLGLALLSALTIASCTRLVGAPTTSDRGEERAGSTGSSGGIGSTDSTGPVRGDQPEGTPVPTTPVDIVPVPTRPPEIVTPPVTEPVVVEPPIVELLPDEAPPTTAASSTDSLPTSPPASPVAAAPTTEPMPTTSATPTGSCREIQVRAAAFASNSADLSPDVRPALEQLIPVLLVSNGRISVVGHTDRHLTRYRDGNQGLSDDRSRAVADLLVELGVPEDRLDVSGQADREPRDPDLTAAADTENRRVEIRFACDGDA